MWLVTFECGAFVWLYLHVNISKPLERVCNFLKQLNKVSSCPNLSQQKVLLTPERFYVKYCCTLSHPLTPCEIIISYPSPWGIFSAWITVPMFILVNLRNRTGEGRRVWQDKPDNNFVWNNFSPNFTLLWSDLFLKDRKALRLSEYHERFAVLFSLPSCYVNSL